jgi:hypothetical protein
MAMSNGAIAAGGASYGRGEEGGAVTNQGGRRGRRTLARGKRRWHVSPEGVIIVFVAVMLAGVGYAEAQDSYLLQRRGQVVNATVVHETHDDRAGSQVQVRFVTREGRTVKGETETDQTVEVGQTVQVVYDPHDPARMQAADEDLDYRTSIIVFGGGAFAMLIFSLSRFWSRPEPS